MLLVYLLTSLAGFLFLMLFGIVLIPLLALVGLVFAAGALITRAQY